MKWLRDFRGRAVRLTQERLNHNREHPEMAESLPLIEIALREPEAVVRSRSDPACLLHYRFLRNTIVGDKWLCIVVKYSVDEAEAFVLTAYLTGRIKAGEHLWPET